MSLFVKKYNFTRAALRTYSTKIGFIGVGNMGSRMAQNLLKKEETLVIYDTSEQNLKSFENQKNVTIANSVKEVAQNSECIITMLPDDNSVWSVFTEHDGILKNTQKENILLIDCSTINPELSQKISGLCKEKQNSFLDAPVSGGVVGAENGTLTFMVGGCELTTKVVEPLLFKMGSKIIYCGSSGMGQAAKLCNNMLLAISMVGVAESMNCGIKFGLDAKLLASVINSSTGRCWSSDVYNPVPGVIENVPSSRDYQGGFKTRFLVKDINLALNLAKSTNSSIPLALKVQKMYADAVKKGYGDLDFSVIYKYLSENKES